MKFDHSQFRIHDVSAFPLVQFRDDMAAPGYALAWQQEMELLLIHAQPFVVLYDHPRRQEEHEDRKQRGLWLKHNKQALAAVCRGLVSVEPDAAAREQLQAIMPGAVRAFGVPQQVAASRVEALEMTQALLALVLSSTGR